MKIEIINENNKKIKNIGIFLWIVSALMMIRAVIDPWLVVDLAILVALAYFAYYKLSRKSIYWASLYYLFDTFLFLDIYTGNLVALVVRSAVLFWLISTCFAIYEERELRKPEMRLE